MDESPHKGRALYLGDSVAVLLQLVVLDGDALAHAVQLLGQQLQAPVVDLGHLSHGENRRVLLKTVKGFECWT